MSDRLAVLLEENVPAAIRSWLRSTKPSWTIQHASDVALGAVSDDEVFRWAQEHRGCPYCPPFGAHTRSKECK